MTFDVTAAMWDHVTTDHDAEAQQAAVVRGKVASARYWPFLAQSRSDAEFGHRLAMIEDDLLAVVPAQAREAVLASIAEDWKITREARAEAARAELEARQAKLKAEAAARPVLVQPDQEFFHVASGKWLPAKASAFSPDPSDAARYNRYPEPQAEAVGGSIVAPPGATSIGPDGFPIDVAVGEQRSPEAYARQTTPGVWTVTPGTEWKSNPMPNAMGTTAAVSCPSEGAPVPNPSWAYTAFTSEPLERPISCTNCGHVVYPKRNGSEITTTHTPGYKYWTGPSVDPRTAAADPMNGGYDSSGASTVNPDFFSQGTEGITGPPSFPTDPGPEPRETPLNEGFYGQPSPVSPGSQMGTVDGQRISEASRGRHPFE